MIHMMMYGAGLVQVFVIPHEPVVESNLPVLTQKPRRDNIQILGRKIDKFTVQFVSSPLVRTFLPGSTCGFSSILK